ncbi:uncharacterized protein SPPG_02544 [Spizellomyces punctatus DAOM BR117]|uniref:MYND-type domain-containing protein n=1 Tax=Spizellomyces punctatus (strain DAOM BR117) TaxID=645134 RepID=A0A0L0HM98_SPIPD|nr:uncharacterized protein SPPG_02544 [Spizellomyces punctatus DAOM BR117]KND02040.1 hypothetical protein SPPG_02544 [Spizellomyces punctatus DAOM BR117]|eukprot:XP_016610079.1 hypothetical protein SPPG_02544 [Spizellomyces punctatus DAOM BR117]
MATVHPPHQAIKHPTMQKSPSSSAHSPSSSAVQNNTWTFTSSPANPPPPPSPVTDMTPPRHTLTATTIQPASTSLLEKYLRHIMRQLEYCVELIDDTPALAARAQLDAAAGNPSACIVYALCLHAGSKSLQRDDQEALKWLTKAANTELPLEAQKSVNGSAASDQSQLKAPEPTPSAASSDAPPQNSKHNHHHYRKAVIAAANAMLGDWYRRGVGCGADYNRSFKYLKRATELGDVNALSALAEMYERGAGIHRDDSAAFVYYKKSAEQGYVKSMFKVGQALEKGKGVNVNYMQAKIWYRKATSRGHFPSAVRLATLSLDPAFETYDNLVAAAQQVKTPRTLHDLALAHSSTKHGAKADIRQMKKWLLKAAKMGHARSQWLMGKVYQDGRLHEAPTTKGSQAAESTYTPMQRAFYWYHRAALQGFQPAQWAVCSMYRSGIGIRQDNDMADKWQRASNRCGCQKIRTEAQDQACITGYSLNEANGPIWNGLEQEKPFNLVNTQISADAGLGGMPGISGTPVRFDLTSSASRSGPAVSATATNGPTSGASAGHGVVTSDQTEPYDTDSDGYKDMKVLLESMYLTKGVYLQDRGNSKTVPTLLQLEQYRDTNYDAIAHLKNIKTTFHRAEEYSKLERHEQAVAEYAKGFRAFEGLFDLQHYNLRLLAAVSVSFVLARDPNNSDALLVDCFLNLLNRPCELGIVACTKVIQANAEEVAAYVLRAGYRTRLMLFEEALKDYEIAYRIEGKNACNTPQKDGKECQKGKGKPTLSHALAEIYYQMGVCHSNMEGREHRIASIKAMVHYLGMVGADGRRVPDAHYTIAGNCLALDNVRKLVEHFSKGLEAETVRFHFYPPIINQDLKTRLTLEVKYAVVTGSTHVRTQPWSKVTPTILRMVEGDESSGSVSRECLACGSLGKTRTCGKCRRARYCSVNCQIAHWIRGHSFECRPAKQSPSAAA